MASRSRPFVFFLRVFIPCLFVFTAGIGKGAAVPADAAPNGSDYLFRVSLRDNAIAVFLPSREIGTKEAAAAYLDWAGRTHIGRKGKIRAFWDDEAVSVSEPENANLTTNLLSFVRDSDSAVDPSGRNRFQVSEIGADGPGTFRLSLVSGPEPIDPRVCLTNVFVLPRAELFARWERELEKDPAAVRAEIEALRESGLFRLSVGRGNAWRDGVATFVADHSGLRPKVLFENRTGVPVRVSVDGGEPFDLGPGKRSDSISPAGSDPVRMISWRVRRAEDASTRDGDYDWDSGETEWRADAGEDAVKTFFSPPGKLRSEPVFALPREAVPAGVARPDAFVRYEGDARESAIRLESSGGALRFKAVPHRRLISLRLAASGWKDGFLRPRRTDGLAYGETEELVIVEQMVPKPKPWPVFSFRNRFSDPVALEIGTAGASATTNTFVSAGGSVRIDFGTLLPTEGSAETMTVVCIARASEANDSWKKTFDVRRGGGTEEFAIELRRRVVAAAPEPAVPAPARTVVDRTPTPVPAEHPWPKDKSVSDLSNWFKDNPPLRIVITEGTRTGEKIDAAREAGRKVLSRWQSFWGDPETSAEKTFREVVAHIATCRDTCAKCQFTRKDTFLKGLKPKEEAFLALGKWEVSKQREFCSTCPEAQKYNRSNLDDDRESWTDFVKTQVNRPGVDGLKKLAAFWRGEDDRGRDFAALYRAVELGTFPDGRFDGILRLPTFEERRKELFRMVVRDAMSRPLDSEIGDWISKLDKSVGLGEEK